MKKIIQFYIRAQLKLITLMTIIILQISKLIKFNQKAIFHPLNLKFMNLCFLDLIILTIKESVNELKKRIQRLKLKLISKKRKIMRI